MMHIIKVSEIPYPEERIINTSYWKNIPQEWMAVISPGQVAYGNGIVGDRVRYVSYTSEDSRTPTVIGGIGEIALRDIRGCNEEDAKESKFADDDRPFKYMPSRYPDIGEVIGRFVHVTDVSFQNYYGTAPEHPNWKYANNQAKGYAWAYPK
jgi:hypothetical protein